jgi:hypothetical protein
MVLMDASGIRALNVGHPREQLPANGNGVTGNGTTVGNRTPVNVRTSPLGSEDQVHINVVIPHIAAHPERGDRQAKQQRQQADGVEQDAE